MTAPLLFPGAIVRFPANDPYGAWREGELAEYLGPESDHPDAAPVHLFRLLRYVDVYSLSDPDLLRALGASARVALTAAEIQATIGEIRRDSDRDHDDEKIHERRDELYLDVLTAIANGASDPAGLARAALEAEQINFARWYA